MSEEQRHEWVVEPPGAGEIQLQVAVGEGVELTDEQKRALGELLETLEGEEAEVVGHSMVQDCTLECSGHLTCKELKVGLAGGQWSMVGSFTPRIS